MEFVRPPEQLAAGIDSSTFGDRLELKSWMTGESGRKETGD